MVIRTNCRLAAGEDSLVEVYGFHGVVAAVAGPEGQIVDGGGGCDQGVSQFNAVAFGELAQEVSGALADLGVDRDAVDGGEKSFEGLNFLRACAMPELSNCDRRAEQGCAAAAYRFPSREKILISGTQDLNQDIRIDQESFQEEILVSRLPLRRRRT